ncbi:hypothetical protein D3C84_1124000 [compost metagenome]
MLEPCSYVPTSLRSSTNHIEDISEGAFKRTGSKIRTDLTINQSLGRNRELGSLY